MKPQSMFKPRFLMSERERSLRDLRYSGIEVLREKLREARPQEREEIRVQVLVDVRYFVRDYLMSILTMAGAVAACIVNLVIGVGTRNYWLLSAAIMIVGVITTHLGHYQFNRDLYYGHRRLLAEFEAEASRFPNNDET